MSDLRVELLAVEGCPHFERARQELEAILREGIIETPIQVILVGSQDDAEFLGFQGSPTIRIDSEDVVPQPELPIGLSCRIYRDEDGREQGWPPAERVQQAVRAHRQGRLAAFQRGEARLAAEAARAADAEVTLEAAAESGPASIHGDPSAAAGPDIASTRNRGGR